MNRQIFKYHPKIGYTFIPGVKARIDHEGGGYLVRTNQMGFRSDVEFIQKKQADSKRILIFGDSFTAADGVSNKFRYSDLLETSLPGVEVYNFGLPGSGTDQQMLIFEEFASSFEYDLVILGVLVENIRRVVSRYRPYVSSSGEQMIMAKPYFTLEGDGKIKLHHNPVPEEKISIDELSKGEQLFVDQGGRFHNLRKIVNKIGGAPKDILQKMTHYQPVPGYDVADNRDWLLMKAILERWISIIKTKVVIFPIPLYHFVEELSSPANYQKRFNELNVIDNAVVYDPLPELLKYSPQERRQFRFENDVHPTKLFHQALAKSLIPIVEKIFGETENTNIT